MKPAPRERLIAALGALIGLMMILMKIVPGIPGRFATYEWLALAIWVAIGLTLSLLNVNSKRASGTPVI
jgi:hypothetical protein